jgi:hypothetical protein
VHSGFGGALSLAYKHGDMACREARRVGVQ